MAANRWYRDGLNFECTQCGNCCTGAPGYVWMTRREIAEVADFLNISVEAFAKRFLRRVGRRLSLIEKPGGDCVFYEKGCTVYPVRPTQCRTYPFWPDTLATRDTWEEERQTCPGIGRGRVYPLEEIQRIRSGEADASREGRGSRRERPS